MSNETLYYAALKKFNSATSGSGDFEKICRKIIKFIYPKYEFKTPEGGQGTKDGGYDGYDPITKTKLACSIDKNYKEKIKKEMEKSINNGDLLLIYLSNQIIPEIEVKKIKAEHASTDIQLIIYGIDELSRKIDDYCETSDYDPEIYDLLYLHFFRIGKRYKRGDARPIYCNYSGNIYNKKITIINNNFYSNSNTHTETRISKNPLSDIILRCCINQNIHSFKNIVLCGIGYLGKSFLMELTYNNLINEFSNKENYDKYQYIPFVEYCKLKNYQAGSIMSKVKNTVDPLLISLDGLDEISENNKMVLNKEIQNILHYNERIRFVTSGRNSSFIDFDIFKNSVKLYLEKYIDNDDEELVKLLENYKNTPIADLLPIPSYRNFVSVRIISKETKLQEFYTLMVQDNLCKDKERHDISNNVSQRMSDKVNIDTVINAISSFCYESGTPGKAGGLSCEPLKAV